MARSSWLSIPKKSHFSIANIPFGIISTKENSKLRAAIAIGDHALDLSAFAQQGGFTKLTELNKQQIEVFSQQSLNAFAALGRPTHKAVRSYLQAVLYDDTPHPDILKTNEGLKQKALIPLSDVQMHLPMTIGDYTDFFAGRNHAFNVGVLFRGPENALQPNYNHLPVAYHGRASSVVVSGTSIRRPNGQVLPAPGAKEPVFKPSGRVDMELEMGMFICRGNELGQPVKISEAEDHIFGYVLMNDWSGRDIQQWEYVPLGPFNAKNFGTTISAWVVLPEALEPFRTEGLSREVELQKYLQEERKDNVFNINLEVDLTSKLMPLSWRNLF
jgi:fumarylacetoacetase